MFAPELLSEEILVGITVGNLLYVALVLAISVVANLLLRLAVRRLKAQHQLRKQVPLQIQLMEDVTELLTLWLPGLGLYLVALALPPLDPYSLVATQFFIVLSILVTISSSIRVQTHVLRWYGAKLGRRTAKARVINSLLPIARWLTTFVVMAVGLLIILAQLGIAIGPLVAGLGIGGVAIALALQGTLTNLFSGLNVISDGTIRLGDYIETEGGVGGYVEQIGWRTTTVRTLANNIVLMPNNKLAESVTTNYDHPTEELAVYANLGVAYGSDLDQVERVTLEVAKQVMEEGSHASKEFEPAMRYTEFGDSNIQFRVVLWAKGYEEMFRMKHNLIKSLLHRYRTEGIEISFPNWNLYMRDNAANSLLVRPPSGGNGAA